jgi:hypothetical protein
LAAPEQFNLGCGTQTAAQVEKRYRALETLPTTSEGGHLVRFRPGLHIEGIGALGNPVCAV